MIARVLVIFTIAAESRVLLPWIPSQAAAAAVTDDVSLIAVPAKRPNPSLLNPSIPPNVGKNQSGQDIKKKNNRNRLGYFFVRCVNYRAQLQQ